MRIRVALLSAGLGLASVLSAQGRGSFRNLGFETPVLPLLPPPGDHAYGPITAAPPGSQGYLGNNPENLAGLRTEGLVRRQVEVPRFNSKNKMGPAMRGVEIRSRTEARWRRLHQDSVFCRIRTWQTCPK